MEHVLTLGILIQFTFYSTQYMFNFLSKLNVDVPVSQVLSQLLIFNINPRIGEKQALFIEYNRKY